MGKYSVVLFHSSNHAIWASKKLKEAKIWHIMVPIPRQVSSDCGYCVKTKSEYISKVKSVLDRCGIEYNRFQELKDFVKKER